MITIFWMAIGCLAALYADNRWGLNNLKAWVFITAVAFLAFLSGFL